MLTLDGCIQFFCRKGAFIIFSILFLLFISSFFFFLFTLLTFCIVDEDSPALEHIRYVKQYQNAVMAFYYTDADNQVQHILIH